MNKNIWKVILMIGIINRPTITPTARPTKAGTRIAFLFPVPAARAAPIMLPTSKPATPKTTAKRVLKNPMLSPICLSL